MKKILWHLHGRNNLLKADTWKQNAHKSCQFPFDSCLQRWSAFIRDFQVNQFSITNCFDFVQLVIDFLLNLCISWRSTNKPKMKFCNLRKCAMKIRSVCLWILDLLMQSLIGKFILCPISCSFYLAFRISFQQWLVLVRQSTNCPTVAHANIHFPEVMTKVCLLFLNTGTH